MQGNNITERGVCTSTAASSSAPSITRQPPASVPTSSRTHAALQQRPTQDPPTSSAATRSVGCCKPSCSAQPGADTPVSHGSTHGLRLGMNPKPWDCADGRCCKLLTPPRPPLPDSNRLVGFCRVWLRPGHLHTVFQYRPEAKQQKTLAMLKTCIAGTVGDAVSVKVLSVPCWYGGCYDAVKRGGVGFPPFPCASCPRFLRSGLCYASWQRFMWSQVIHER